MNKTITVNEPTLVVMAAGMGSRFGGLKQMEPVGKNGEIILDYSLADAKEAGFKKAVLIIKEENLPDFQKIIAERSGKIIDVSYAFQKLELTKKAEELGAKIPSGRTKPLGTAQAVLSAESLIDGPFAVVNADDYYGKDAFKVIYDYLTKNSDFCMVGYQLGNTLSENGTVSRGVCSVDEDGYLEKITETTDIGKDTDIPKDTVVSMNMWGFPHSFLDNLSEIFSTTIGEILRDNPEKGECYLPSAVQTLLEEGLASVKVLRSKDRWYGVTYKEDLPLVKEAFLTIR